MFKKILLSLFLVTAGALTAGVASYAWTEPLDAPPNGNVSGLSSMLQGGALIIQEAIHAKDFIVDFIGPDGKDTSQSVLMFLDRDGDGITPKQGDCNDNDPAIKPGGGVQFDSGKDGDCNGTAEYTTDVTTDVHTWYAGSACTKGGGLVNFEGYINGYRCTSVKTKLNNFDPRTTAECIAWESSISRLFTMTNQKSKHLLCLYNNYSGASVLIGTSGNAGSCGGTSEQAYALYRNGYNKVPWYNNQTPQSIPDLAKATGGVWHVWCN